MGPSSLHLVSEQAALSFSVLAPPPPRSGGAVLPPLPALARLRPKRALSGRGSAAPALSATRVPACTWHMPSALPCRAVSAPGSNGWRRLPSRALLLPPRREVVSTAPLALSLRAGGQRWSNEPCFRDALPLASPPARKREDAGASPGS